MRTLLMAIGLCCLSLTANSQTKFNAPLTVPASVLSPKTTSIQQEAFKFELKGGLIFVEAQLGQRKDSFILDTGAPTVVINSEFLLPELNGDRAVGLSGTMDIQTLKLKDFSMDKIHKNEINAIAVDISHLEEVKGCRIKGLIGYEAIRDHEIMIDYESSTLTVLEEGDVREIDGMVPVEGFKMKIREHFPVIKVKIGKRKYLFGLDTGAEVNVVDINLYKRLNKYCKGDQEEKFLQGVDKGKTAAISTRIKNTMVNDLSFKDMDYVFADISYLNRSDGYQLDGILGYPFLKQAKFSLNYNDKMVYIWEALPVIEELLDGKNEDNLLTSKNEE